MKETISWQEFSKQPGWPECREFLERQQSWTTGFLLLAEGLYVLQQGKQGGWDRAHSLAQQLGNIPQAPESLGCWLHAHLHKIEGDTGNSRYWYGRSGLHCYEDFPPQAAQQERRALWEACCASCSDAASLRI